MDDCMQHMQHVDCKPHHRAKTPCRMISELKGRMDAKVMGMQGGRQNIVKINAFHEFNRTFFRYAADELGKNPEKCDEIQLINWRAEQAGLPGQKKGLEAEAHGLLSELAHFAIARMKNENCNGTAAFFREFLRKVVIPSRQETA